MPCGTFSSFPIRILRDLDALPLQGALMWKRKGQREKIWLDFILLYADLGGFFGTSPKQQSPYHEQEIGEEWKSYSQAGPSSEPLQ